MPLMDGIRVLDVFPKMEVRLAGSGNGFSLQSLILSGSERDTRRQLAVITLPNAFQRYN